jgi:protein-glutamine gamma-glutamyltransferase
MLLALAGVAGVLLQFGTVIGPQGGVALLVFLSGAKLLETRSARDRLGLLFVGFFVGGLFSEFAKPGHGGYMTLAAIALVAAMIANTQPSCPMCAPPRPGQPFIAAGVAAGAVAVLLFPRLQIRSGVCRNKAPRNPACPTA